MTRREVIERLLVEASDNDSRKVSKGSVQLSRDGLIDWTEKTRRGLVARTGRVDFATFWRLVDEALA